MASSDVDQKWLGRLAKLTAVTNPLLSSSLYQVLGLSVLLARKLFRARKLRKLDTSRDTKSLSLYHHIIWLSREGLSIVEVCILPYTQDGQVGPECRVLAAKLRASFYHVFCLFHNQPPVSQINIPTYSTPPPPVPGSTTPSKGAKGDTKPVSEPTESAPTKQSPASSKDKEKTPPKDKSPKTGRQTNTLRDPVASITSETSFLTNPYATGGPVGSPPPVNVPPGLAPVIVPQPSAFLLPPLNFLPLTSTHFTSVSALAATLLPGSHPLRLSVALEHTAFLWDCAHDRDGARRLARRAIKDVYRAQEGMDDADFEDAAELVGVLGRMMKRRSWEGTPRGGMAANAAIGASPVIPQGEEGMRSNGALSGPASSGFLGIGSERSYAGSLASIEGRSTGAAAVTATAATAVETEVAPRRSRRGSGGSRRSNGSRQSSSGSRASQRERRHDEPEGLEAAMAEATPPRDSGTQQQYHEQLQPTFTERAAGGSPRRSTGEISEASITPRAPPPQAPQEPRGTSPQPQYVPLSSVAPQTGGRDSPVSPIEPAGEGLHMAQVLEQPR